MKLGFKRNDKPDRLLIRIEQIEKDGVIFENPKCVLYFSIIIIERSHRSSLEIWELLKFPNSEIVYAILILLYKRLFIIAITDFNIFWTCCRYYISILLKKLVLWWIEVAAYLTVWYWFLIFWNLFLIWRSKFLFYLRNLLLRYIIFDSKNAFECG